MKRRLEVGGTFAALNLLEENADNLAENIHGALVDTASEVLGKARKKRPWMTSDILILCDRRKKERQEKKQSRPFGNAEVQSSQSSKERKVDH